jgi:predicted metal-dependent peptidase
VDALIYLTDGCGCYPFEKPDYPVYFVVNVEDMDEDFDEDFDCFGGPEWIKFVKMS